MIYVLVVVAWMGGGTDQPQTYITSYQEWSSQEACENALAYLHEATKNSMLLGKCLPK